MVNDRSYSRSALVARNGVLNVKCFYYPYGARRGVPFNTITAKHFTGHAFGSHETALPGGEGLSFYNARWYDPKLGAFLSADSIVPAPLDPQSFNRYAYAGGNPLRFSDPSGHTKLCGAACEDEYKWSPTKKTRGGNNVRGLTSGYDTKRGNSTQPISASVRLSRQASVRTVVSWLLYDEMLPNAQGSVISDIRFLNEQLLSGVFAGIWASKKSKQPWAVTPAVAAKATAMLMWKNMVQSGAEWDHKSVILERFGEWAYDERDGFHYRYDIWSNIHYGYVGRSAGFTSFELMAGAGAAQIIDRTSAPSYWSTWFDDPYDQAAIRVGIELYDKYGLNVSITEFMGTFDSSAYLLPRFGPASGEGSSEFGPFTGGR